MAKQAIKKVSTATSPKNPSSHHDVGARGETLNNLLRLAVKAQRSIDKNQGGISNSLLVTARVYQKGNTTGEVNAQSFIDACKVEELFIRSTAAKGLRVDKLPRCWTQAKSNIKAALVYDIDLNAYTSESALRKEVVKQRGLRADKNPVRDAMASATKSLLKLGTEDALDIVGQLEAFIQAALAEIVPVTPVKAEGNDSSGASVEEQIKEELAKQAA